MATIEKINKVYKRLTDFQAALAAGEISDKRLYLIEDKRYMYINGVYYDCSTVDLSDYVTSEALTAALQPYALSSNLASVATSGSYNDLSNKPTIPSAVTESTVSGWGFTKNTGTYSKPSTGIPKSDLASAVQTSLGKADTAMQAINGNFYGVCDTDANTFAKVVTIDGFPSTLSVGQRVTVKFTYAASNTDASNPMTLNVNGTGAYIIYRYGTTLADSGTTTSGWAANSIQNFTFDGNGWVRDYWSNTTYSNAALGQGYATCATAAATVAKTATLSSYALTLGGIVAVKFTNAVPAGATLNINSKGAKSIYHKGVAIKADVIKAGDIATFIYSSQYHLISIDSTESATSKVSHGTADTTFTLTPNVFHVWDTVSALTLTLGAEIDGVENEYLFEFTSGSTATTLSLPSTIKWLGGNAPEIEANTTYQISIIDNLGVIGAFPNS